eukprot:SAG31_NODE_1391_length_8535_cov_11.998696_11_plen_90_part_00
MLQLVGHVLQLGLGLDGVEGCPRRGGRARRGRGQSTQVVLQPTARAVHQSGGGGARRGANEPRTFVAMLLAERLGARRRDHPRPRSAAA